MKKYMIILFCCLLLIPALVSGFSHAKYASTMALSFNLTVQTTNGETLLSGSSFSAELANKLIPKNRYHIQIFFDEYSEKTYGDIVGTWDGDKSVISDGGYGQKSGYIAVDASQSGSIRAFGRWESDGTYDIYILSESGKQIKMNTDCSNMFTGLTVLVAVSGLENVDTSGVTNMSYMFKGCEHVSELNLSKFDTSNVTNMSHMFDDNNWALSKLDLSHFNTQKVTDMSYMFNDCYGLQELMLGDCFDTSQVTDMSYMFSGCSSLSGIDVSSFDTAKVTNMEAMFMGCGAWNFQVLDLSSFDTSEVRKMKDMFNGCHSLGTIYVSEKWSTEDCEPNNDMFDGCVGLFGQKGTSYKSNYEKGVLDYASIIYARVDGGSDSPGYLTSKAASADLDEADEEDTDTEQENSPSKADKKPQTSTTTTETVTEETETVETTETEEIPSEETPDEPKAEEPPAEAMPDDPAEENTEP